MVPRAGGMNFSSALVLRKWLTRVILGLACVLFKGVSRLEKTRTLECCFKQSDLGGVRTVSYHAQFSVKRPLK